MAAIVCLAVSALSSDAEAGGRRVYYGYRAPAVVYRAPARVYVPAPVAVVPTPAYYAPAPVVHAPVVAAPVVRYTYPAYPPYTHVRAPGVNVQVGGGYGVRVNVGGWGW